MNPDRLDELLACYALDALDDADRRLVDELLTEDPAARARLDELEEAVVLSGHEVGPPDHVWEGIARRAFPGQEPIVAPRLAPFTRRRRVRTRLLIAAAAACVAALATGLVLSALNTNGALAFFTTPSDLKAKGAPEGRELRLGGLVEAGSVTRQADGQTVVFRVSDGEAAVNVVYRGSLPDLFRENQGVVVTGKLERDGTFLAAMVLAKHDERYMPREVVDALKKSGHWQEGESK
jgi:cytochrome c-type biogenesis protein CcmE